MSISRDASGRTPLTPACPFRAAKESWIRQKYVDKSFVRSGGSAGGSAPPPPPLSSCSSSTPPSAPGEDQDVTLGLYRAALAGDLVAMAAALAQGAEVNGSLSGEQGRTALIGAAVGVRRKRQTGYSGGFLSAVLLWARRGRCWPASSCC